MSIIHPPAGGSCEPSAADLAGIEKEWPLIAAERDLLDAQIAFINAGPHASVLDRRRVRRAEQRVMTVKDKLAYLEVAPVLPCASDGDVVGCSLRIGGVMGERCGSTWDRDDQTIAFDGPAGSDSAA
ncbi:DUF6284 family protein (plasmid) [Kribbella sp. CWNU-51]